MEEWGFCAGDEVELRHHCLNETHLTCTQPVCCEGPVQTGAQWAAGHCASVGVSGAGTTRSQPAFALKKLGFLIDSLHTVTDS